MAASAEQRSIPAPIRFCTIVMTILFELILLTMSGQLQLRLLFIRQSSSRLLIIAIYNSFTDNHFTMDRSFC